MAFTNKRAVLIALIALLYILAGCSAKATSGSKQALDDKIVPAPTIVAGTSIIPSTQSTYCWGKLGCADYVGGKAMVEGKTPFAVKPESEIHISFEYDPAPSQVSVYQYKDDKTADVPLNEGRFRVPADKGVYYYGVSAYWTTEDGKYSKGDTSSVFVIEVK
ncbi:hypothetical protein PaecuDRAFT_1564 [Paenibacillus curdlanolyticus YK9]|uniref:Lipoprotein n=1 Tax=Paenibacillus curdlanolyticus YK9 TaxID=717606 RepID=E0I7E0_9BACL|nr:hypothetical protein [Paenibacillus curdlanolyticus]EFM11956.1 hypothetical protein PaecuDRAFT_1564 [Paenibacillus curdlanolyticus YK9]